MVAPEKEGVALMSQGSRGSLDRATIRVERFPVPHSFKWGSLILKNNSSQVSLGWWRSLTRRAGGA